MKKSKLFGMAAMAAMMLGSCSTDEVVNDYSPENAIQFGTYVGRDAVSRATVTTTDNIADFGVFAYYTGQTAFATALSNIDNNSGDAPIATPNFMYNQDVNRNDANQTPESAVISGWNYSPLKYWPNNSNDKITFFAYSPFSVDCAKSNGVNSIEEGLPSVTFTVNETVKQQQDLLWANPEVDKTKQTITENVKFTFNHALSRIGFQVQAMVDKVNGDKETTQDNAANNNDNIDNDDTGNGDILKTGTTILVKQVTLKGKFIPSGTLAYSVQANSTPETYEAKITGTASTTDISYVLSATSTSETNLKSTEEVNMGTQDNGVYPYTKTGQKVTNDEAQLNGDDSYIMIIPQDFTNTDLTIEVVYDVITEDTNLSNGVSFVENTISSTFRGVNFEAGKAYTFSLHLGMTSVKLSAEVDAWDEANGKDYSVNVPLNTGTNP